MRTVYLAGMVLLLLALSNCSKKQEAPVIRPVYFTDTIAGRYQVMVISGDYFISHKDLDTTYGIYEVTAVDSTHVRFDGDLYHLSRRDSTTITFDAPPNTPPYTGGDNVIRLMNHLNKLQAERIWHSASGYTGKLYYGTRIQ